MKIISKNCSEEDLLYARIQGNWHTFNNWPRYGDICNNLKHTDTLILTNTKALLEGDMTISIIYNPTYKAKYIDCQFHNCITRVPPKGVFDLSITPTTQEVEYGYIIVGLYVPLITPNIKETRYQRSRKKKLEEWVINEFNCVMPETIAYY